MIECLVSDVLLDDANFISSLAIIDPAANEQSPFEHVGRDQKVERDATESVPLEEGHQEAEAHEHHRMDVHEHFERERK